MKSKKNHSRTYNIVRTGTISGTILGESMEDTPNDDDDDDEDDDDEDVDEDGGEKKSGSMRSKMKRSNNKLINFFKGFSTLSKKKFLLSNRDGISKAFHIMSSNASVGKNGGKSGGKRTKSWNSSRNKRRAPACMPSSEASTAPTR